MRICQLFLIATAVFTRGLVAGEIKQSEVGPNTCGPCAAVHSLYRSGSQNVLDRLSGQSKVEKAKSLIAKYGGMASIPYGERRTAYTKQNGATDVDMRAMVNRLLQDANEKEVVGTFLVREDEESEVEFVARVQRMVSESIGAGFHPLLSVRALAAEFDEKRDKPVWNSKGGHWIAIHDVQPLSKTEFVFRFSDSIAGEELAGIAYLEQSRPAVVPITFTVDDDGKEVWNWIPNKKTLTIVSPGMPLGTKNAEWHERTLICARYLILRTAN